MSDGGRHFNQRQEVMVRSAERTGILVLSLDFELYWGVRDSRTVESYRENLLGVRKAVPLMLEEFSRHGVRATWAVVGLLFFRSRQELLAGLPKVRPAYENAELSIYDHLERIGESEEDDPYHYAPSLIRQIVSHPEQEIGTHTFSHYYCLEKGQGKEAFESDLQAARMVAASYRLKPLSLVFPRNQYNPEYLGLCRDAGIKAFRGVQRSWMYRAVEHRRESAPRRALRLLDSYLNLSGHNCYSVDEIEPRVPVNIPASRFLRPFSGKLAMLEELRLKRITADMRHAAKNGLVYHLWWHPHNFGANQRENFNFLGRLLETFEELRDEYGMRSLTMSELAGEVLKTGGHN